jgi:hypothetical protein
LDRRAGFHEGGLMFFSWAARIVAIIILVLSLLRIGTALLIVNAPQETKDYVLRGKTTGFEIDRGIYGVLIAIALGTLAEISFSIRRNR